MKKCLPFLQSALVAFCLSCIISCQSVAGGNKFEGSREVSTTETPSPIHGYLEAEATFGAYGAVR